MNPYIFNVVQRIEDPEDIQTILDSLLRKIVDSVITVGYLDSERPAATPYSRVARVADTIGTANQRLQGNVGYQFSQGALDKYDISKESKQAPKNLTNRSHGSSYRNRIATSNVAPPQHSRLYAFARA
jgi:hypothetical protein